MDPTIYNVVHGLSLLRGPRESVRDDRTSDFSWHLMVVFSLIRGDKCSWIIHWSFHMFACTALYISTSIITPATQNPYDHIYDEVVGFRINHEKVKHDDHISLDGIIIIINISQESKYRWWTWEMDCPSPLSDHISSSESHLQVFQNLYYNFEPRLEILLNPLLLLLLHWIDSRFS